MYPNLNSREWSQQDKEDLLRVYYGHHTGVYKSIVGEVGETLKTLAAAYSMQLERISKWHRNIRQKVINKNSTGRPRILLDEDI